jgi:phosphatidylglycerol---prolipoprotein diacylglyceryl transferase
MALESANTQTDGVAVSVAHAVILHTVWDMAAWLMAVGLLYYLYRSNAALFTQSSLAKVQRGYFLSLSLGGLCGAYLIGSANMWLSGHPGFARSIVGGITGAITAVEVYKTRQHVRGSTGGIIAPALAFGIAVGRVGCQIAGLADFTYGRPSTLPWAVNYGDGVLRHPVALYESLTMALLFIGLMTWLAKAPAAFLRTGFYVFCLVYGAQRFVWEFFKPYETLVGPFNFFHFVCAGLIVYAVWMLQGERHADRVHT